MANNIQIVGDILNTSTLFRYGDDDIRLISSQEIQRNFGDKEDYIEYYIYDVGGNLLNLNYDYKNFKLPPTSNINPQTTDLPNTKDYIPTTDIGVVSNINTQSGSLYPIIEIDPIQDLKNLGYTSGEFKVQYNFFTNKISSPSADLFIKEISPDRTEIRTISTILNNEEIEQGFNQLVNEISSSIYFSDYLLNFGDNQQVLSVNIALNKVETGYEILFKLYEPLPENINEKTSFWVVDEKVDPYVFDINLDTLILPSPGIQLRGPNFNIPVKQQGTISTTYQNYDSLLNNLQSLQSSSYSKILNLLTTQSIDINVDYTNFSEFSFFGSVKERLKNFYTKVKQIEDYNNLINIYTPNITTTSSLQLEISSSRNNVNDIISKFDGFEYYLYFESSSYAWPKSTSTLPYQLYSTSSLEVETWYNNYTSSAELYDENNVNNLKNSLPSFVIDDPNNSQYLIFLNMMGQYFDNIWIFLKSITDINIANNNLEEGVSKDLVYHVLKSYGIKLYNDQGGEALNQFLIGSDSGSANFDNDFSPTGSYLNNIPRKDLLAEIYKRIYHNLPYLVKNKGTVAGVEGLITTFGITGSILNTKEYGGNTKSSLLKGYNNNKVRITPNPITGSVLSPFISLQQHSTSSNDFRDNDLHYLDVSFSPQTQIDTYISGAIASNNPTFNIDDYIGDPRQQYSNSYSDLNNQRKLYFETGTPFSAPFTGSNMDYNGFIRLIQFFDNALFKMITDFVPARTSLSTGVTINSPVLERNKISYAKPTTEKQLVYDADYNGPEISPQYGFLYNNLTGSKVAFYNGELEGSNINYYNDYFEPINDNYYLHPTSSLTENDINIFNHSDFNILLNNITSSRLSLIRKNIEPITGKTGSLSNRIILTSPQLQDSYLSLTSYNNSRYEGSKTTSLTINKYTGKTFNRLGELIYNGDSSYGTTAALDSNVRKIGLFTQINENRFLKKRNNISLKYLIDEFGNLTELNQQLNNWSDIQNIFKANTISTIALFDNQKFSNQKLTDGNKLVYNSGYVYEPIYYFTTGSSQDTTSSFDYAGDIKSNLFKIISKEGVITTSPAGSRYQATTPSIVSGSEWFDILNLFQYNASANEYNNGDYFQPSSAIFPYYDVPEDNKYTFTSNFSLTISSSLGKTFTGSFIITKKPSSGSEVTLQQVDQTFLFKSYYQLIQYQPNPFTDNISGPDYLTFASIGANKDIQTLSSSSLLYDNTRENIITTYTGSITLQPYVLTTGTVDFRTSRLRAPRKTLIYKIKNTNIYVLDYDYITIQGRRRGDISIDNKTTTPIPHGITSTVLTYTSNLVDLDLLSTDQINFKFIIKSSSFADAVSIKMNEGDITNGTLRVDLNGSSPVAYSPYINCDIKNNTINLTGTLSTLYDSNYTFIPSSSLYTSSLYANYGDVNYPFSLTSGDLIVLLQSGGSTFSEFEVNTTTKQQDQTIIRIKPSLPSNINATLSGCLFLKKLPDENNLILSFNKNPGNTSYGFLIPENIHPDVLKNINNITREVKQKLLADQQGNIIDNNI